MSQKTTVKVESQKDLLLSKLLPALSHNPFSASYEGEPTVLTQLIEEDTTDTDPLVALRSKLFARESNHEADSYATVNVMESLVLKHLDQVVKRFNACSCNKCKCDIAAHALNRLPAHYIVTEPHQSMKIGDELPTKEIMTALVNAVIHVRNNPNH